MVNLDNTIVENSELLDKLLEIIDSANAEGYTAISIFTRSEYKMNLVKYWFGKMNFDVCEINDNILLLRWAK